MEQPAAVGKLGSKRAELAFATDPGLMNISLRAAGREHALSSDQYNADVNGRYLMLKRNWAAVPSSLTLPQAKRCS